MTSIKEIKKKIHSVHSTKKITKAMEMVSIVKMKKMRERINTSLSYFKVIQNIISNIQLGSLEYNHAYLNREFKNKVGFIVVSTDRGLCSNLNTFLFKNVLEMLKKKIIKIYLVIFLL
ncbi:MAG: FoF1 ATP synthase subunit gamma [Buchnera aphidicola (Chaetogeoica yunlongensis)]